MRRAIAVETEDTEGLCYDPERAKLEGLYEELSCQFIHEDFQDTTPITEMPAEVMEWIINRFDPGVNIGPNDPQEIVLAFRYVYDYGTDPVFSV